MAEEQSKGDDAPASDNKSAPAQEGSNQGFGLSSYGDAAGNKIQDTLSPIGKPLGQGLEQVTRPVGSVLGPVVDNGLMKAGRTAGGITGVGAGGMDTKGVEEGWKQVKEDKRQDREMHEPVGGKDQTAENPLGL